MNPSQSSPVSRAPAFFVQHGGGPLPLLGDEMHKDMIKHLKETVRTRLLNPKPAAIILVTAHWEETVPTVSTGESPALLFDYYGFPDQSYKLKYPAKGSPQIAEMAFQALRKAGLDPSMDSLRGWDHGVFVPMMLIRPEADIPIVQLSVCSNQSPDIHLRMGEALAPLRDQNVAIVGSGMTFHNMSALMGAARGGKSMSPPTNAPFDDALIHSAQLTDPLERRNAFVNWRQWPLADFSHPVGMAEHFMPMLVVVGASLHSTYVPTERFQLFGCQFTNFAYQ